MKQLLGIFAIFFFLSCNGQPESTQIFKDVSYGTDDQQLIDIYLPENRAGKSKVFLLLHGGGWRAGSKDKMDYLARNLRKEFPDYAVVNIGYRLATPLSPAYTKQIDDIKSVIAYLKQNADKYNISNEYAFIGSSAGAHLSLLYSYAFDNEHNVKAVCSLIGPTDFTDPSYTSNPRYSSGMLQYLVGAGNTYEDKSELYKEVSPVSHVTDSSPPTIMFHGTIDKLVPKTQGPLLQEALNSHGVYNEMHMYKGEGHGNWNHENAKDIKDKMFAFFHNQF